MKKIDARKIAYYGLLIALNIILTRLGSIRIGIGGAEGVRIGFGGFPTIFAGILFGPLAGGMVGAVGDIIGMILSPMGAYMPHFTLTAALTGIIPGLIMRGKDTVEKTSSWRLFVAIGAGEIITDIILVPYFLNILFYMPYIATIPARIIALVITIPLFVYATKIVINRIYNVLKIS